MEFLYAAALIGIIALLSLWAKPALKRTVKRWRKKNGGDEENS